MKKFVCVLLAMTMVFAFAACGKQESGDTFVPVSEGKFTVAISPDFAPMEFVDITKSGQEDYCVGITASADSNQDTVDITLE